MQYGWSNIHAIYKSRSATHVLLLQVWYTSVFQFYSKTDLQEEEDGEGRERGRCEEDGKDMSKRREVVRMCGRGGKRKGEEWGEQV